MIIHGMNGFVKSFFSFFAKGGEMQKKKEHDYTEAEIRAMEDRLKGYGLNRKLLRMERYEQEYFGRDTQDFEAFGEAPLARARMFEIRHFIMDLPNSDEKLFLYYRYIKGESVVRCGELLGISRAGAFRMRRRALLCALRAAEKQH